MASPSDRNIDFMKQTWGTDHLVTDYNKKMLNLETAKLTGSDENQTTLKLNNNFNNILINFSPRSKERRDKLIEHF